MWKSGDRLCFLLGPPRFCGQLQFGRPFDRPFPNIGSLVRINRAPPCSLSRLVPPPSLRVFLCHLLPALAFLFSSVPAMRPISGTASPRLSPVQIPQFVSESPHFSPVHIPKFDTFSPPMDAGDASSDDGDSLNTPLTEHHHHRLHSCDVYDQPDYSQDAYSSPEHYIDDEKANMCSPQYRCLPQRVPSVSPGPEHSQDLLFPTFSSPSGSNITSPSYSTRTLDPTASPFTPTRQTFPSSSPVSSASPFLYPDASPSGSTLPSLPSLSLSNIGCDDMDDHPSLLLSPTHEDSLLCKGRQYSALFHPEHMLNPYFVRNYRLEDELGAGGYGFVMTARHRSEGHEVAVKFIIKDKVPEHAWWEDEMFGRVPTEVMLLSLVNHENIVRCLDLFEDEVYFYLVSRMRAVPLRYTAILMLIYPRL